MSAPLLVSTAVPLKLLIDSDRRVSQLHHACVSTAVEARFSDLNCIAYSISLVGCAQWPVANSSTGDQQKMEGGGDRQPSCQDLQQLHIIPVLCLYDLNSR
ncbi:hypothetical protein PoB_006161900 [Plakobranchus ocellatus]|uniref:Uncharacterized protein n=1 Tax=Plakobranchus ocellatus TaxID=259542 RepID=A0AAV4CTB4_9GAST|nr:hypothetical protein PoB_006161900 [Plakobranchus ocellatus]